ncbi:hypothetical protein [Streptomyces aureocirculatus]|uniref:hypothetical protein n=1 Tax=Streptomyces aureocirculatus TaxID=67275 RepID=UPI0013319DAF|nr:hypothetical protein [Streptomyces aureocirculatus]
MSAALDKLAVWRDGRKVQQEQLQAAEDFVFTWSGTVDPDSYQSGAELSCGATNRLANLFRAFYFWGAANWLQKEHEHGSNCNSAEPHPEIIEENE